MTEKFDGPWQVKLMSLAPGEVVEVPCDPEQMSNIQSAIRKAAHSLGMRVVTKRLSRRTLTYWREPFGASEDLREEK